MHAHAHIHQNQCDEEQTLIYLQQDYYPVQHLRVRELFFVVIIIIGIDQISSHKYQPYFSSSKPAGNNI